VGPAKPAKQVHYEDAQPRDCDSDDDDDDDDVPPTAAFQNLETQDLLGNPDDSQTSDIEILSSTSEPESECEDFKETKDNKGGDVDKHLTSQYDPAKMLTEC